MFKSENISPLRRVFQNASILLSGDIGANVFKLLTVAIFSHSQGPEKLGYFVLFTSFIEVVDRVFNFQTWQAFIKFSASFMLKNERHKIMMLLKYSFFVDLISLVTATIVALFTSKFLIEFFNIPQGYYSLLLIMSSTILFKLIDISTGIFRLYNKFGIQAKIAVYTAIFRCFLYVLVVLISPVFEMFIYATVLSQFASMILKLYYLQSILEAQSIKLSDIFMEKIDFPMLKKLKVFSFIINNNFDVALRLVSIQLDMFILGKLYSSDVVGVYKITKEASKVILRISSPVYQSIYPEFSKLMANQKFNLAKKMTLKISTYAGILGLVFYLTFYFIGEGLIALAFGDEMIEAYSVSLVYIIAVLINLVSLPFPSLMHAMGLAKQTFYNQFFSSILYCSVLFYLINQFSIYGAAISMIIYHLLWLLGSLIITTQYKPR